MFQSVFEEDGEEKEEGEGNDEREEEQDEEEEEEGDEKNNQLKFMPRKRRPASVARPLNLPSVSNKLPSL